MKNTFTKPADFWQERDFGAKISATFEFIGVHWRPLSKCLVYFVLPVALFAGIGLGLFTSSTLRVAASQHGRTVINSSNGIFGLMNFRGLGLGILGAGLAMLLLVSTVYAYVRARLRLPAAELVTPAAVWAELRARLGRVAQVVGLVIGLYVVLLGGFFLLVKGGIGTGKGGGTGAIMLAVILFPIMYFLLIYASVALSLFFPVLWFEDQPIFASFGRCFQLIKGRWWATWGLLLVTFFLQSMLTIVFALPNYVLTASQLLGLPGLDSGVLTVVGQSIYMLGFIFTYCVPLLALAFQYFHLVEQKEGFGLSLLVDQLGQPAAAAQPGYYQPNEEGEY